MQNWLSWQLVLIVVIIRLWGIFPWRSQQEHLVAQTAAGQIGAGVQGTEYIVRTLPPGQLRARVNIQRRRAAHAIKPGSWSISAAATWQQDGVASATLVGADPPMEEEDALVAVEGGGGARLWGGWAVVRVADDLAGQAVVLPPQQLEHGAEEDPLELLPKDAVDDEVHRAVHGDEEVGGLGEGQEDLASMLKDNVNTVTTRNTV